LGINFWATVVSCDTDHSLFVAFVYEHHNLLCVEVSDHCHLSEH
jgi:hypothetical protein